MFGSKLGRLARRSSLGNKRPTSFSLFGESLGNNLLVGSSFFLASKDGGHLFRLVTSLALQHQGSYETLNLGSLASFSALLVGKGTRNNVLANIVIFGQVEQLANVVGPLGTQATGDGIVGQTRDILLSLLGNDQVKDRNIMSNDASTDGLALTLSDTARAVGLVSLLTEDSNTVVGQDTLTHGKALFVVSSGDAKNISFEFFSQNASLNLLGHAALVEALETLFVINFKDLLHARGGARNIKLRNGRECTR